MTRSQQGFEGREVARFVDGEMPAAERAAFEERMREDGGLRAAVAELRRLRRLFEAERSVAPPRPSAGFRERVLAAGLVAPLAPFDDRTVRVVETWSRRVLWAAAAIAAIALSVWAGVLRGVDSGRLEASPAEIQRVMQELDALSEARIRSASGEATPETR